MSRENVEAMQRAIEIWNERDHDAYVALVDELVHPEIEWYAVIAQLVEGEQTVYRGIDGMRKFWDDWHDVFDFRFDETEIRDLGDQLLVLSRVVATGRASGVGVETPLAMVINFEGNRVIRERSYLDYGEALEAVGLRE